MPDLISHTDFDTLQENLILGRKALSVIDRYLRQFVSFPDPSPDFQRDDSALPRDADSESGPDS